MLHQRSVYWSETISVRPIEPVTRSVSKPHKRQHYWYFNQNVLTYNTFNAFILKGDAPPRMELCFDTLMVRAYDEPDAVYGLLAETVKVSPSVIVNDGNLDCLHKAVDDLHNQYLKLAS